MAEEKQDKKEEKQEEKKDENKDNSEKSDEKKDDKVAGSLNKAKDKLKALGNKFKNIGKNVAKKIFKNPLFWKILLIAIGVLAVLLLFIVIIGSVVAIFTYNPFNFSTGKMSSLFGMNGDAFYGARFIYKDDDAAAQEIVDSYKTFTYQILLDVKGDYGEGDNAYTVELNISNITTQKENSEAVKSITQTYALNLATNYVAEGETAPSTLEDSAKIIDHFGFTEDEVTIVIDSVVDSLVSNSYITVTAKKGGASGPSNDSLKSDLNNNLGNKVKDTNVSIYKQITTPCDKVFVYDYFLKDDTSGLEELEKHNYIAMVYMAKKDVTILEASYRFLVEGDEKVYVALKSKLNGTTSNIAPLTEVDASWYQDEEFTDYEAENINIPLKQFTALNSSNQTELSQPQSLNSLIANNSYSIYFANPAVDANNNVSYLSTEDNPINWIELINADNFMFVECQAQQPFLMAEFNVEYR